MTEITHTSAEAMMQRLQFKAPVPDCLDCRGTGVVYVEHEYEGVPFPVGNVFVCKCRYPEAQHTGEGR